MNNRSNQDGRTLACGLRLLLIALIATLAVLACTPPFSRDALIQHLQIPKLYLQHGGIYEIPELPFSYYPMNVDLLYMGALWLGSDILPKYIHMAFALATALLLRWHLRRRLSASYAWLGALFFLSIPVIIKLSSTAYVDLGLVFFSTASLLLLFRWLETGRRNDLLLAGISCGLGMGTKYNGLLVLFILAAMVPVLFIRTQEQKQGTAFPAVQGAVLFCCAALFAASPWLIRNAVWTGNPVYPLYNSFFKQTVTPPPADTDADNEGGKKGGGIRGVFATRSVLYGEGFWQLFLLPVRIFFEGQDGDPRYFDGRLNPFLLLLPLLAFVRPAERQVRLEQAALAVFSLLYFLYAFNTSVLRIRYLVPMVPFLVILSMYGLRNLEQFAEAQVRQRHLARLIWLLPATLLLTWNGSYLWQQFQEVDPLSYITGRVSRDAYLTRQLPEYPVMQYANKHLPASANILCLFLGWRGYYLDRPHSFDSYGNKDGLLAWLNTPGITVEGIRQRLAEKGIGYLLIRRDLLYQQLMQDNLSTQQLWLELERQHLRPLFSHREYSLYQAVF